LDIILWYYVFELCEASLDYCSLPDDDVTKYSRPIPSDKDAFIQMAEGLDYIYSNNINIGDIFRGNKIRRNFPMNIGNHLLNFCSSENIKYIVQPVPLYRTVRAGHSESTISLFNFFKTIDTSLLSSKLENGLYEGFNISMSALH